MVAKDPDISTPGVRLGDQDNLEVEWMPMGYVCPRAVLLIHDVFNFPESYYIPTKIATG